MNTGAEKKCSDCRWWREQAGSAHVMCPIRSDFAFGWGWDICELFAPVEPGETVEREGCNQFMHWHDGSAGVPTQEQAKAYLEKMHK